MTETHGRDLGVSIMQSSCSLVGRDRLTSVSTLKEDYSGLPPSRHCRRPSPLSCRAPTENKSICQSVPR